MQQWIRLGGLVMVAALAACADSEEENGVDTGDTGGADADGGGTADGGLDAGDSAVPDTSVPDGGVPDGGVPDGGVPDGEDLDVPNPDGGSDIVEGDADAGGPDADVGDAGDAGDVQDTTDTADASDGSGGDVVEPLVNPLRGAWNAENDVLVWMADDLVITDVGEEAVVVDLAGVNTDVRWIAGDTRRAGLLRLDYVAAPPSFDPAAPSWYVCPAPAPFDSLETLAAAPAPDAESLATGCYGAAWSPLTAPGPIAIVGEWSDAFGGQQIVTETEWATSYDGVSYDRFTFLVSNSNSAVARNADTNTFSPGLWSRFEWTEIEGDLYYCQIVFGAATLEEAFTALPADPTDPATGGCSTFPWTPLLSAI